MRLVLPVYKEMFQHMPKVAMFSSMQFKISTDEALRAATMGNHYTSVSFGRLSASAGRNLRLSEAHFEAALEATIKKSGLILAPNLQQEQFSFCQFYTDGRRQMNSNAPFITIGSA